MIIKKNQYNKNHKDRFILNLFDKFNYKNSNKQFEFEF